MLVLSRKAGQEIAIGNATVTVVRITGGRVRLGITAPPDVPIIRGELDRLTGPPEVGLDAERPPITAAAGGSP